MIAIRKFIRTATSFCLVTLLFGLPLLAPAAGKGNTDTAGFDKGVLWRVDGAHGTPSWILGTLHSDDPRVTKLPPLVQSAFDRAERFVMEVVVDQEAIAQMTQSMFLPKGESLNEILGGDLYERTRKALFNAGLNDDGLERTKPWVVITMLSMPRPQSGVFLDLKLHLAAAKRRIPIAGLESMGEQIAVFDQMSLADQAALLEETVALSAQIQQQIDQMIALYIKRDLAGLLRLGHEQQPGPAQTKAVYDSLMQRLLTRRNELMAQRVLPHLKAGGAFVAIGALHLPGQQGVLNLLKKQGLKLVSVY